MSTDAAWRRWRAVEARLRGGGVVVLDGGTGSEVERVAGQAAVNPSGWTSTMNLTHPDAVRQVHRSYFDAGAEVVTANTYATCRHVLAAAGLAHRTEENNRAAVRLARAARDEWRAAGGTGEPLVAGSVSIHAPGDETAKLQGRVPWPAPADEVANYVEQLRLLVSAGVDLIFVELLWNMEHAERVAEALRSFRKEDLVPVFIGVSLFNDRCCLETHDVRAGTGIDIQNDRGAHSAAVPLRDAVPALTAHGAVVGVNVMHTKSDLCLPALRAVRAAGWRGALGVYPDCGEWHRNEGAPSWAGGGLADDHLARCAAEWRDEAGVQLFGGCCGFGPAHIRALSAWARGGARL